MRASGNELEKVSQETSDEEHSKPPARLAPPWRAHTRTLALTSALREAEAQKPREDAPGPKNLADPSPRQWRSLAATAPDRQLRKRRRVDSS